MVAYTLLKIDLDAPGDISDGLTRVLDLGAVHPDLRKGKCH